MTLAEKTSSYRHIIKLALPIIISGIAQNVILATDVFFMARVDEVSLDAVGLAGLFFNTLYILGLGFSIGVQILIARRHGEKQYRSIGEIFDNSLIVLGVMSLVLWVGMEWLAPPVLKLLIHSDAVYNSAILYLDDRAWGITFAIINLVFRAFFIGISAPRIITISTILIATANVVLNYALIFGNWGFPAWGIEGSAVESSIAEIVGTVVLVSYTLIAKYHLSFDLLKSWKWKAGVMKQLSLISSPVMLQYFLSHAGWFLFFIIIEQNGERALAISVIIRMVYMFQMVPFWGFSSAANTLVSFTIGEDKQHLVMPLLKKISMLSFLASLLFVVPNLIAPSWILGFAVENPNSTDLITESIPTLYVISVALLLFALSVSWFSGISGSGNTRAALLIETILIATYIFIAWLLGIYFKSEVHIIWITEPFYFLMMALVSWGYMKSGRWKGKVI